eukprot:scaffold568_cov376-Prasinococcus_capsulatus_cf.AAC.9
MSPAPRHPPRSLAKAARSSALPWRAPRRRPWGRRAPATSRGGSLGGVGEGGHAVQIDATGKWSGPCHSRARPGRREGVKGGIKGSICSRGLTPGGHMPPARRRAGACAG